MISTVAALLLAGWGVASFVPPAGGAAGVARPGNGAWATRTTEQPIVVSAAISLSEVLEEIAGAYRRAGGGAVRFNLASSNALARQIVSGAPVDVFISADQAQMDFVRARGSLGRRSPVTVAANQLVVIAAPDRAHEVAAGFPRAAAPIRRLAIGDPNAVPAGVYARAYLERQGLWQAYEGRIVPTLNVRAAMAAVENGGADAAIVYATDARHSRSIAVALRIPLDRSPFIGYYAAVLSRATDEDEAYRFLAFLTSGEARRIFTAHGFLPVPAGR